MTWRSNQRTPVLVSIVLMAFVSPSAAKVIYVDVNAPGQTHDGTSWENAYKYLQDALVDAELSPKPLEIRVAQGIYKPDQSSADPNGSGSRGATFQLINSVTFKGGYAGFGKPDPNAHDIELYETILSGDLAGDDVDVNDPRDLHDHPNRIENSYHVVTGSGTDATAILDSFSITGGKAEGSYPDYCGGGGLYNNSGSPTVRNCAFTSNSSFFFGGGMFNYGSNPTLVNCTFITNGDTGMDNDFSSPRLTKCLFRGNSGGGIYNNASNATITNCIFTNNSGGRFGGGVFNQHSTAKITNCRFSGNTASRGGGIGNSNSSRDNVTLNNCTFVGNRGNQGGGVCDFSGNLVLTNCVLWNNEALDGSQIYLDYNSNTSLTYSDVQGGWPGLGNIDADPCFADVNNRDYHLKSQAGRWDANSESWVMDYVSSPCIDAGNPGCPVGDEPSPNGNRKNMGAYGGTAEASKSPAYWRSIADITNDWVVDFNDLKVFAGYWLQAGECIPSDFDRSQFVDFNDFAIFGDQWRQKGPGPGITYDIGVCIPVDFPSSALVESEPTRFTVTVEGQYILFEDMMRANCCADELELLMTVEEDLITINEIEHTPMPPCPCICDYPITAKLGPFEPGIYILEVYQDGYFVGTTTVDIAPAG